MANTTNLIITCFDEAKQIKLLSKKVGIDFNQVSDGQLSGGEKVVFHYENEFLIAGLVATFVAWRWKNLLLTIVVGMLTLLAWRWGLGVI